jgi:D-glycero-D-manno-heptose 1,7-bisphosphate phosphatase
VPNLADGVLQLSRRRLPRMARRSFVLLDRDGTINRKVEGGYVTSWADFEFLPGALEGLAGLTDAGFGLVVVTNQAAVGKGLVSPAELDAIHDAMAASIQQAGGRLARVYVCPHVAGAGCACRKPRPGLLHRAATELGLDLARTYMVGDSPADVEAGLAAGCPTILLESGRRDLDSASPWRPRHVARDLAAAARLILAAA